jgi:hypothetical protein
MHLNLNYKHNTVCCWKVLCERLILIFDVDIPGLRLLSHPTLRYYIEVTPKESKKMEAFTEAVLIQTLKGKRRYQLAVSDG